jgi:hypothetical protein
MLGAERNTWNHLVQTTNVVAFAAASNTPETFLR